MNSTVGDYISKKRESAIKEFKGVLGWGRVVPNPATYHNQVDEE